MPIRWTAGSQLRAQVVTSNPFLSLYRDTDVEGMSDGWDDLTAYGHVHQVPIAAGDALTTLRLVARNSGLFYLAATVQCLRLTKILADRMATENASATRHTSLRRSFKERVPSPAPSPGQELVRISSNSQSGPATPSRSRDAPGGVPAQVWDQSEWPWLPMALDPGTHHHYATRPPQVRTTWRFSTLPMAGGKWLE